MYIYFLYKKVSAHLYVNRFTLPFWLVWEIVQNEEELKRFEDFIPKLLVLNLEDTKSEKSVYRFIVLEKEEQLKIDLRWHLKGTFHEQMELQDFPFDVQVLILSSLLMSQFLYLVSLVSISIIRSSKSF